MLFNKHLIMDNVKVTLIVVQITSVTIYLFIFTAIYLPIHKSMERESNSLTMFTFSLFA